MAKTKYDPSIYRDDPLAALKQATGERAAEAGGTANISATTDQERAATAPSRATAKPLSASLKPSRNTMYLYPEDLTKLRQLSGYASIEHGVRTNDSMIVRAALSLLEADVRFLHALREAELSDRRRTRG